MDIATRVLVVLQIEAIYALAQLTGPQYGQWNNNWNANQNGQGSQPFYGQNNLYPRNNNPGTNIGSNDGSVWGSQTNPRFYGPNLGLFNPNPRQDFSGLYGANSGVFNANPRFNWPNSVNQGNPTQDFFPQLNNESPSPDSFGLDDGSVDNNNRFNQIGKRRKRYNAFLRPSRH